MAHLTFANSASTTLAGAISSTATSLSVAAGDGALFPSIGANQIFKLTLTDQASGQLREIMHVTARSGDTFTVLRGQEGTAPRAWSAGDLVDNLCTAGTMTQLAQLDDLQGVGGFYGTDVGTNNAVHVVPATLPAAIESLVGAPVRVRRPSGLANTGPALMTVATATGDVTRNLVNAAGAPTITGQLIGPCIFTAVYDDVDDNFKLQSAALPIDISNHTTGLLPVARITGIPLPLTTDTTFYVNASTGSDANPGTISQPWLTLTQAVNYIANSIDLAGHNATVVCTGVFGAGIVTTLPWRGGGATNVIFSFTSGAQIIVANNSCVLVLQANSGITLTSTGTPVILTAHGSGINQGSAISAAFGDVNISGPVLFGLCDRYHMQAGYGGRVMIRSGYSASGSCANHILTSTDGLVSYIDPGGGIAVSISGTPAFSNAFVSCSGKSMVVAPSGVVAFTGSATGQRYIVTDVSLIQTSGGGANFFPGSVAGSATNTFNYN